MAVRVKAGERRRERAAHATSWRRMSQWAAGALEQASATASSQSARTAERVGGLRAAQGEEGAEVGAVLGAERGGIEMEEGAIEPHQALPGAKPRARAMRTSCAMRRDSASATARPNGVMR